MSTSVKTCWRCGETDYISATTGICWNPVEDCARCCDRCGNYFGCNPGGWSDNLGYDYDLCHDCATTCPACEGSSEGNDGGMCAECAHARGDCWDDCDLCASEEEEEEEVVPTVTIVPTDTATNCTASTGMCSCSACLAKVGAA